MLDSEQLLELLEVCIVNELIEIEKAELRVLGLELIRTALLELSSVLGLAEIEILGLKLLLKISLELELIESEMLGPRLL